MLLLYGMRTSFSRIFFCVCFFFGFFRSFEKRSKAKYIDNVYMSVTTPERNIILLYAHARSTPSNVLCEIYDIKQKIVWKRCAFCASSHHFLLISHIRCLYRTMFTFFLLRFSLLRLFFKQQLYLRSCLEREIRSSRKRNSRLNSSRCK